MLAPPFDFSSPWKTENAFGSDRFPLSYRPYKGIDFGVCALYTPSSPCIVWGMLALSLFGGLEPQKKHIT